MLSEDNDELTQEEYESILNKFVALQAVTKERNYKLKKMEDELRIKAKEEIAVIKQNLLKEAISLGCDVSENDTKESIRKTIYFARKKKQINI